MAGGVTRNCFGTSKSPSYCIMPANATSGRRPRSKYGNSASSKARESSMARSPRKLKSTTPAPSRIGPTGPASSTMTKAGSIWSLPSGFSR